MSYLRLVAKTEITSSQFLVADIQFNYRQRGTWSHLRTLGRDGKALLQISNDLA